MSDEKRRSLTPEIVGERPTTDMTTQELEKLEAFVEEGLPGISKITPETIEKMAGLYLSGKTYGQVSNITRVPKAAVMYHARRDNWFSVRQDYLQELDERMKTRVAEAKLMSQDFMLDLMQTFQKKIGKKIQRYLATDNEDIANEINLKDIATYIKTLEALGKSMGDYRSGDGNNTPAVGLNLGDGVTVQKNQDGTVEITPKQKAVGEILKQFADNRREDEKK